MSDMLAELATEATPVPPLTDEQRAQIEAAYPGAILVEWHPPSPRIEPETARERQLYKMGYYDGLTKRPS